VYLTGTAGTLTLTTGISVNDITVNPASAGTYTIGPSTGQVLTLNGSVIPVLNVAAGSTLSISTALAGTSGLTKSGGGILQLSSTSNSITGGIGITGGTLQVPGAAASTALRQNEIILSGGTLALKSDATVNPELRFGALSGSGTFNPGSSVSILALSNQTFSGGVTLSGLTVRGAATQTFSGSTQLAGTLSVGSRGGITLTGAATATGLTAINLTDHASLTLDNATTNSSDRLAGSPLNATGGSLILIGNPSGSSESIGDITFNSGQTTIKVQHNAGATGATVLTLNSITRGNSGVAVNFATAGTGLVASGNGARIAIALPVTLANGVIGSSSTTPGYAVVEGKDFASYSGSGASGGVIKVTSTQVSGTLSSSSTANIALTGNGTASGPVSFNTLKIQPSSTGQSLALGTNTLSTAGILLDGTTGQDFSINGGSIGGTSARYFHVWDAARTLFISSNLAGANQPMVKAGDGFLGSFGISRPGELQ
jgi:autotransporter-associated beta strand protein